MDALSIYYEVVVHPVPILKINCQNEWKSPSRTLKVLLLTANQVSDENNNIGMIPHSQIWKAVLRAPKELALVSSMTVLISKIACLTIAALLTTV